MSPTESDIDSGWHPHFAALRVWTGLRNRSAPVQAQQELPALASEDGESCETGETQRIGIALAVTGTAFWALVLAGLALGAWLLATEMA